MQARLMSDRRDKEQQRQSIGPAGRPDDPFRPPGARRGFPPPLHDLYASAAPVKKEPVADVPGS
jgi:hypothetical protein